MIQTCIHCKSEFESRKTQNFCSGSCYHASKKAACPDVTLTCGWCKKEHIVSFKARHLQYCSKACSNSATKRSRSNLSCDICKKKFEVITFRSDKAKFCSRECFDFHMRDGNQGTVILTCENCKKEFTKKYTQRDRRFCSKQCANDGEFNGMWHNIAAGQKISEAASKAFIEGRRNFQKGYKSGYFVSTKSALHMFYRSSYELRALEILESDPAVISFDTETLRIPYLRLDGSAHYYIPDITAHYADGSVRLIEIKPSYQQFDESVITKRLAAQKYCEIHNLIHETWDETSLTSLQES